MNARSCIVIALVIVTCTGFVQVHLKAGVLDDKRHGLTSRVAHYPMFLNGPVEVNGKSVLLNYTHMSMIEAIPGGKLMAAWQGSSSIEGTEDQRIWLAVSKDYYGRHWETPTPVPDRFAKAAMWSPVLHCDGDGRVWLFYSESNPNCLRAEVNSKKGGGGYKVPRRYAVGGDIKVMTQEMNGKWTSPRVLYPMSADNDIPKVVANKLLVLSTGEWLLPFWRQKSWKVCETKKEFNAAGVLRSDDFGGSWQIHGSIKLEYPTHWIIEGTVVELRNSSVLMLMRSTDNFIFTSISHDQGVLWSEPRKTTIPNPDSKISAMRLQDGQLVLAFNDHHRPFTGQAKQRLDSKERHSLKVAISPDDGESWTDLAQIETDVRIPGMLYHYPTLLQRKHTLIVTYSRTYISDRPHVKKGGFFFQHGAPQDGIWVAHIDLRQQARGKTRLLNDPHGCQSTHCLERQSKQKA